VKPVESSFSRLVESSTTSTSSVVATSTAARVTTVLASQTTIVRTSTTSSTSSTLPSGELFYFVERDDGFRVTGGIPYAFKLDNSKIRLYYCENGIDSAVSDDGLKFIKESGVRVDMGCDPTIVKTSDGKFRMYYKISSGPGGPGQAVHSIYSAISNDGLSFKLEGLRIDSQKTGDGGWASVPDAVKLPDGRVRIYYVSNDPQAEGGIMSAISSDGLKFTKESGVRIKGNYVDPAVAMLSDGRYWMLLAHNCPPEKVSCTGEDDLYASTSIDGLNYTTPKLVHPAHSFFDPAVMQTGEGNYRIYYGEYGAEGEPSYIKSIRVNISSKPFNTLLY